MMQGLFWREVGAFSENCGKAAPILAAARNPSVARQHRNDATAMRKKTRGLVLLVLAYIAFFPIEFSVAQDPPRANNLGGQGGVRVFRKRESPVLFSQQGEVRFQKAYVDQNGSIRADGHNLDLFGAALIRRDRICTSGQGARWTCGQRAYMTLRALLAERPITCSFKPISVPPKAVCSVDDQDIAQFLLREGWAELPIDVTDQAYVEASELAHSRGLGIWGDAPP
jgi:hypothetical protein